MKFLVKNRRYIELAIRLAHQSSAGGRYKLGCVIVKGGIPISVGWNKWKTHPRAKSYRFQQLHAEMSALIGIDNKLLQGSTAYVARLRHISRTGMAKPCPLCLEELRISGVQKVYYTTDTDAIGFMRTNS